MRNVLIILVALLVFAAGVGGAAALAPGINQERRDANLSVSDQVYDLPADMAVSQAALGTFRGLAVNFLWQRAENLKNDGKYFEAIELGKLITRLQPRFPKVWEFVSWNMAYNISVGTKTDRERWMWVKAGIDLLQRKGNGIDANPNELALYAQLGWIYFHKVGEFQDNMSWDYKREIAVAWNGVLGNPPTDNEPYLAWLREIRDAPDAVEGLSPGGQKVARWMIDEGLRFDADALAAFTVPVGYALVEQRSEEEAAADAAAEAAGAKPATRPARRVIVAARQWPTDATDADVLEVVAFLRKKVVQGDEYNMRLDEMIRLAEAFGPIDYRQPAAHTLYWSWVGLQRVGQDDGRSHDAWVSTERNVLNGLQTLAQAGSVAYDPRSKYLTYLPQWDKWIAFDARYQSLGERTGETDAQSESRFGAGYRNQMDQAITDAWVSGATDVAQQLYERMKARGVGKFYADRYDPPLDEFVKAQMNETLDTPKVARDVILGLMSQSLKLSLVAGNPRQAQAVLSEARRLFDEYRKLNPNPADPLYQEMQPFEYLASTAQGNFIAGNTGPGSGTVPIESRAALFDSLSEPQRAIIWVQFQDGLRRDARIQGFDEAELFDIPSPQSQAAASQLLRSGGTGRPDAEAGQPRREIK